jgi:erythromycin esterase-like protein
MIREVSMNKFISLLSAAFLMVMIFHFDYLEGNELQLLKELNSNIINLPGGSPLAYEDKAFLNLDPLFDKAQIIGLGEGTHGTREFFEMKQRLFQYLVKKHKCRALGFEYGFRFQKSLEIEKYITTGKGDLKSIINESHWIHRNREFLGLIKWMRQYNSDKNKDQMIHFFGIDSQIDIWYQNELSQHVAEVSKELHQAVLDILEKLIKQGKIDYRTLNQEAYQEIRDLLYSLKEKTRQFFLRNPNTGEKWARELLLHNIESHILSHECRYKNYKKEYPRDRHMASHGQGCKNSNLGPQCPCGQRPSLLPGWKPGYGKISPG